MAALLELGFSLSGTDQADIVRGKDFVQIGNGPFDIDLVFAPDGIESFDAALRNAERVEAHPGIDTVACNMDKAICRSL